MDHLALKQFFCCIIILVLRTDIFLLRIESNSRTLEAIIIWQHAHVHNSNVVMSNSKESKAKKKEREPSDDDCHAHGIFEKKSK